MEAGVGGKGGGGGGENPLKKDICDKIYPDGLYQRSGGCILQIFYKKYLQNLKYNV